LIVDYDCANLLFSGPCNAGCPHCIGRQIDPALKGDNLDEYPPRNLEGFIQMIQQHGVQQVVFSGVDTDPQLYRHERRLLEYLRQRLGQAVQFSLHTNGRLALCKLPAFNLYDRVCLSLPSFDPRTYRRMMGIPGPPDVAEIVRRARRPVKVSCLVQEANRAELPSFLERCWQIGVRRVVLRKLYGERRAWETLLDPDALGLARTGNYRGNAVYDYRGVQVTLWDFEQSESTSINLFSTGVISTEYLLERSPKSPDFGVRRQEPSTPVCTC
jgi:MoaA/NifB/PqqE/SkfB family radical SAM enzyme